MLTSARRAPRLALALLLSSVALLVVVASSLFIAPGVEATGPATLSRTPWQMRGLNPIVYPVPDFGSHGAIPYYSYVGPIPAVDDPAWGPAPDGDIIAFGSGGSSRLGGYPCLRVLDYTFFQTLVDIPSGTTLTTFTIAFSGMDDGSRVTIYNSAYPGGLVIPGSYVYLGGSGTTNLAPYVVAGETNRVVITQIDDCPVGNSLGSATVVLNGETVVTTEFVCDGLVATIVGTEGDDVIYGTDGFDVIMGLGGNDTIYGRNHPDHICGGDGNDTILGGGGDDRIFGEAGNDVLSDNDGDDVLWGGIGNDWLSGGAGADALYGEAGNDTLKGGAAGDYLDGGDDVDSADGGPGADTCLFNESTTNCP